MIITIMIIWGFWLSVIGMMVFWRRSWVPLLVIPFILTAVTFLLHSWSPTIAFWCVVISHGSFLTTMISVVISGRKEGDDPLFKRPPID
jgi:hypothetical protein